MTQVTIAVPTHETLSEEFTVDVEAEWPNGDPIEGEITAVVTGRVGHPEGQVTSIIIENGGSVAISVDEVPDLRAQIVGAMASNSPTPAYE